MNDHVKVSIRNLYKIFGDNPKAALADVRAGMTKPELLAQRNHVLGLSDINVDMREGRPPSSWACRVRANRR